ncbi:hypothetical protein PHYSODRAFT_526119 [Phytophthora sojae]|uniref:Uncharacterized protein n=1 Tax=Phytophthora sojae (strain P6497) TaxID=1094619 RepID=G5A915_PHYSP|nr:hypothetical protein PHYSODRAFT_526119 [Phytophthora sojae]EGZ08391.1 hypothetical protein PHYSODRAFT_526119 [Phytophthora sojae]|eukprot:XP_009536563.1 hypothetical protein PHYSODRAFT_526119 [Phytophthora sojae]
MDLVDRLLDYVATVPASESVDEVKDQLSAYTHRDLRAACMHLDLQVPRRLNKKGGFIATLVNYWKGEALLSSTKLSSPSTPDPSSAKTPSKSPAAKAKPTSNTNDNAVDDEVLELASFVQQFPADGTAEELRDQLNGCKSRTLRSTCVLLELQPHRTATKANFVTLLVNHWQGAGATAPKPKKKKVKETLVTPKAPARVTEPKATPKPKQKRTVKRDEEEKVKPKRTRAEERVEDEEEQARNVMASSLEKAKVVQEWASAIEILSRVDGSDASISSIRVLIDGVMDSALNEL